VAILPDVQFIREHAHEAIRAAADLGPLEHPRRELRRAVVALAHARGFDRTREALIRLAAIALAWAASMSDTRWDRD